MRIERLICTTTPANAPFPADFVPHFEQNYPQSKLLQYILIPPLFFIFGAVNRQQKVAHKPLKIKDVTLYRECYIPAVPQAADMPYKCRLL